MKLKSQNGKRIMAGVPGSGAKRPTATRIKKAIKRDNKMEKE